MSSIIGGTTGITFPDSTVQTTAATTPTAVANLSGGAAGVVPYQTGSGATSFTAAGTTGQVLTSAGTGTPTWSTPSAGAMTLISTLTASSSASLAWTGLSGYDKYQIIYENIVASSPSAFYLVLGTGSTTYVTSGYYASCVYANGGSVTGAASNNQAYFPLGAGVSYNPDSKGMAGNVLISGFTTSGLASIQSAAYFNNTASFQTESDYWSGVLTANTTTKTAIKIYFSSGNITSGTASLYGISS